MEWNSEVIARLRSLWAEGLSTAEIGRRLGASKNAVVGKAHRLNLEARPSPIRRDGGGRTRRTAPRRVVGPTLPPLTAACECVLPQNAAPASAPVAAAPQVAREPQAPPPLRVLPQAPRVGRVAACCWPLGEPGTPSFRFCDADSAPGKPYCEEHAQIAYVRVRDRREEAA